MAILVPDLTSFGSVVFSAFDALSISFGNVSVNSPGTVSISSLGMLCVAPSTIAPTMLAPDLTSFGTTLLISSGTRSTIFGTIFSTSVPMPPSAVSTLGSTLSAAVSTLSTKLFISPSKSWLLSAMPTSRFFHAALADAMEPCIVVDASSAVVPVMPISVCTTWMASTMSA